MRLVLHPNTPAQKSFDVPHGAVTIGRSQDNTIVLDDRTAAEFHAVIRIDGGEWVIRDLAGHGDLFVDGHAAEVATLQLGAHIRIAATDAIVVALGRPETEVVRVAPVIEATIATHPTSTIATRLCATCGEILASGARFCARCGDSSGLRHLPPQSTGVLPRLALLFSLCGPLLIGVGWLLGGIMGLVALARSQRGSGRPSDREIAWWAVLISVLWFMVIGGGASWYVWRHTVALRVKWNEDNVSATLRSICLAQFYTKYAGRFDGDRDGICEFVRFDRLVQPGGPALPATLASSPMHFGYYFAMPRADENGFSCTAIPNPYGVNGRDSFLIDERGMLFRADARGAVLDRELGGIDTGSCERILVAAADELAGDLVVAAEAALADKQYATCTQIVANVRVLFPNASVLPRIDETDARARHALDEAQAERLFAQASALLASTQDIKAVALFRTIAHEYSNVTAAVTARRRVVEATMSNACASATRLEPLLSLSNAHQAFAILNDVRRTYPEASDTPPLSQRLFAADETIAASFELLATNLVIEARAKETAGDYEAAYTLFLAAKTRYARTQVTRGIDAFLARNRALVQEREATKLVDNIVQLAPSTNATQILDLLDLLSRGYSHTDKFKQNQKMIRTLEQECQVQKHVTAARAHLDQRSYRAALASIEQAIVSGPNLSHMLKDERAQCYLGLGDAAYESQDYVKALEHYQHYLKLQLKDSRINTARFFECNYQAAKARIQHRDFADAEHLLLACAGKYDRDAEFGFLYGYTLMNLGRWQEAVPYLARNADPSASQAREARIYLGYCQYQLAIRQDEIIRVMVAADEDLTRLMRDYAIAFNIGGRTSVPSTLSVAQKPASTKTFLDLALDTCVSLDNISVEMDRLNAIPKTRGERDRTRSELWVAQWSRVRALSQDVPNQLNALRASASADAFRKQRMAQEIAALRNLYLSLGQTLAPVIDKSHNRELAKVTSSLAEKLTALQAANESFSSYADLEEQRRHSAVSLVESLVTMIKNASLSTTVIKQKANELRATYDSTKETEMAVQALRALADAYSIVPAVASVMLADPATAETMRSLIDNPATRIPVSLEPGTPAPPPTVPRPAVLKPQAQAIPTMQPAPVGQSRPTLQAMPPARLDVTYPPPQRPAAAK